MRTVQLLDVLPGAGEAGGRDGDDGTTRVRDHRIELELGFEPSRRGATGDRKGIGRARARVSSGHVYRAEGGMWWPSGHGVIAWLLRHGLCPVQRKGMISLLGWAILCL